MAQTFFDIDSSKSLQANLVQLNFPVWPVILLLGEFEASLRDQVASICERVIAPLSANGGALLVDDGAPSGCAAVVGQVARDQDQTPPHVGIVPSGKDGINIDTNHE